MSVFFFNYDSYCGFRASRSIGGQNRCRYFSCIINGPRGRRRANRTEMQQIKAHAVDYDNALARWQAKKKKEILFDARPTARAHATTTVKGIRYGKKVNYKRGRKYVWCGFVVGINNNNGEATTRFFSDNVGYEKAWKRAVDFLVDYKQLPLHLKTKYYARIPKKF